MCLGFHPAIRARTYDRISERADDFKLLSESMRSLVSLELWKVQRNGVVQQDQNTGAIDQIYRLEDISSNVGMPHIDISKLRTTAGL